MTDTLADSRTSSRMFTEGVPLVVEDVPGRPAAERAELLADPGFGRYFTDRMFVARYRAGAGLVRRPADRLRAAAAGPERRRRCTTPSRSSRASRPTPSPTAASPPSGPRPTPPASSAAPSGWPCRRCPRRRSSPPSTRSSTPTATGCPPAPTRRSTSGRTSWPASRSSASGPAHEYLFLVIASPAGAYFPRGVQPVSVYLSEDYIRAAPGGTGDVKCAGNYAASLLAQEQAIAAGCDQVVWLDAVEKRYVEEMGGMNLFFVLGSGDDAELVTPALTGTLLPGITRDSLITMARELGHTVTERLFSVDEWRAGVADGTVTETFACGTAAVITPGRRGQGPHRRLHRRRRRRPAR